MYQLNKKNVAAFIILVAAVAVNSMTIPIVKGNTWSYSYRNETYFWESGDSAKHTGLLRFSIETVRNVVDTTFFTLSYYDSGSFNHRLLISRPNSLGYDTLDSIGQYRMKYNKAYRAFPNQLFQDTIVTVDTLFSPGYEIRLLSFIKQRDTTDDDIFHLNMNKTTDYMVTVNGNNTALIYACYLKESKFYGCLACCDYHIFDTIAWIPVVGLSSFAHFDDQFCQLGNGYDIHSNSYILISFNDTPMPTLSRLSVKSTTPSRTAQYKTGLNRKIVALSGKGIRNGYFSQNGNFNLQGQKLGNFKRSQLIICR